MMRALQILAGLMPSLVDLVSGAIRRRRQRQQRERAVVHWHDLEQRRLQDQARAQRAQLSDVDERRLRDLGDFARALREGMAVPDDLVEQIRADLEVTVPEHQARPALTHRLWPAPERTLHRDDAPEAAQRDLAELDRWLYEHEVTHVSDDDMFPRITGALELGDGSLAAEEEP